MLHDQLSWLKIDLHTLIEHESRLQASSLCRGKQDLRLLHYFSQLSSRRALCLLDLENLILYAKHRTLWQPSATSNFNIAKQETEAAHPLQQKTIRHLGQSGRTATGFADLPLMGPPQQSLPLPSCLATLFLTKASPKPGAGCLPVAQSRKTKLLGCHFLNKLVLTGAGAAVAGVGACFGGVYHGCL